MDEDFVEEIAISDDYLKAIGRLMVNFNQMEAIFDAVLIKLFGCRIFDVRSQMVISGINFSPKVELAKSLANLQLSTENTHLKKFIEDTLPKISSVSATRNAVAHYKWAVAEGDVRGIKIAAKGKLKITDAQIPIEELHRTSAQMLVLMNELFRMIPLAEFAERMTANGAE